MSQPTTGGVAVCVRDLAIAGVAAGRHVSVACPESGSLPGWAVKAGADWIRLPLARQPGPKDICHALQLRGLATRYDVVHLHSSKAGTVGRLALLGMSARRRPTVVFTPHAWSWESSKILAPVYRMIERTLATMADAIVAVSHDDAAAGIRRIGPSGADLVRVIPNGVDLVRFNPGAAPSERSSAPLIVCVGRLARQKGQDIAIRALAAVTTPEARLRLVGPASADETSSLGQLALDLGVADRLDIDGETDEPGRHFRSADVVIFPSRWEAMSLALLESMACGCAIVATAVAGTSILAGGAGVIVPPGDPQSLATAIDQLLAGSERRAELGRTARQTAEAHADLRVTLSANVALWDELFEARSRRRHQH